MEPTRTVVKLRFDTFKEAEAELDGTQWLWPGVIPKGHLTLIGGPQSVGKSGFTLWMSRSPLLRERWLDGKPPPPDTGPLIWCDAEGMQAVNVERAKDFGLPLDKIYLAEGILSDWLVSERTMTNLVRMVDEYNPCMVVVDSLSAAHAGDEQSNTMMMEVNRNFSKLARVKGIAVIVIHHLRKGGGDQNGERELTLDDFRGAGSITQLARSALMLDAPDPFNKQRVRISQVKNNLGPLMEPLAFEWTNGQIERSTEMPKGDVNQIDKAVAIMQEILREGPVSQDSLWGSCEEFGISERTYRRARAKLDVKKTKEPGTNGRWLAFIEQE